MKRICFVLYLGIFLLFTVRLYAQERHASHFHGLRFQDLPRVWEEGIPLGNGIMGTLVWQRDGYLRLALDRADLWDLRPTAGFDSPDYNWKFICDEVILRRDISKVQQLIDAPSSRDIAPTKIPAGALEFAISRLGKVKHVTLDVHTAVCMIVWENGTVGRFFTGATDKLGHFRFENLPDTLSVSLQAPRYQVNEKEENNQSRTNLVKLGYKKGKIVKRGDCIIYRQKGYGQVAYEVALRWDYPDDRTLEGVYCLTTTGTWYSEPETASEIIKKYSPDFQSALKVHTDWWNQYWAQSSISLPDSVLENQWYLEMYKFGAASRKGAPPICLQAVWTADNGQTPPWRGDFHSDLNTQLSYWPGYAANHLEESSVFTDWLGKIKGYGREFTRQFYGVEGLNVPCIATLEGKPIGGWNQYSHSPTASGWLAHHFYLQWKYSADPEFLKMQAYPWVKEVARYFEHVAVKGKDGKRKLPLSSSPEINDNRLDAWFQQTTNYDLAIIRFTYTAAAEMALAMGLKEEAVHWRQQLGEWPDFATDATGLTVAPEYPLKDSHRHLSHMLAIHPLGLLDVSQGKAVEQLIKRSVHHFDELGSAYWVGYSFSWLANMYARIFDGDAAARNLHIFIKAFCSPNSFHLNGDQLKKGYSAFTYKPFTLEGNFACAAAIQEMLLQSHTGIIRVFPAIPEAWRDASFRNMRAMGAFLVDADYENGKVKKVVVRSERGGLLKIVNPFTGKVMEKEMEAGEEMIVAN